MANNRWRTFVDAVTNFLPDGFPFSPARTTPLLAAPDAMKRAQVIVDPSRILSGWVFAPYNPSALVTRKGLGVFDHMKRDEQVKACLAFKKAAVLAPGWEVVSPGDQDEEWEVTELVRDNLNHFPDGWDKALKKILLGIDYGYCLRGDTLVHTLNGDVPIEKLVGTHPWVFSWDGEKVRLGQASGVWLSRRGAECVRVTYKWWASAGGWKKDSVVCTGNHPFMLRDGSYCAAEDLGPGVSLMPFSQKTVGVERASVQTRRGYGRSLWERRSHWVMCELGHEVLSTDHVHHENENKLDDRPENLEILDKRKHASMHSRAWFARATPKQKASRTAKVQASRAKIRDVISAKSSAANKRTWADPEIRARRIAGMTGKKHRGGWHHTQAAKDKIAAAHRLDNHKVLFVEPAGRADVYDMEVPGFHNFSVNHVVVHNSVTEKVYGEPENGGAALRLTRLSSIKPHYLDFMNLPTGELVSVIQRYVPGSTRELEIPVDKLVILSHDMEFENFYGRSELEAAYRPWWVKDNTYKWFAVFLERHGMAPLFAMYNPNVYQGQQLEELKKIIKNIQSATLGIIPRNQPDDLEMWSQQLSAQSRDIFLSAMSRFDADIGRAILVPSLIGATSDSTGAGGEQAKGSFARSQTHFDLFLMTVKEQQRLLATVVNEQVVKQLCDLNFPSLKTYPEFRFLPLDDELKLALYTLWASLVAGKVVNRIPDDETHIRKALDFPENEAPVIEEIPVPGMLKPGEEDDGDEGAQPIPEEEQTEEMRQFAEENDGAWVRYGEDVVCVERSE